MIPRYVGDGNNVIKILKQSKQRHWILSHQKTFLLL